MQDWFYKLNQTVENDNFQFLDIDFSWLKTVPGNSYYLMNIASQIDSCPMIPDGRDLYVLSWFFEPFEDIWFLDLYQRNPQAQFVIISDAAANDFNKLDRVSYFQIIHHSTWFKAIHLKNTKPTDTNLQSRKYKLSSLCSRVNEFKFYITAKLHSEQSPQTYYTWNKGFKIKSSNDYIFESSGYYHADRLLTYSNFLKNNTVNAEKFNNNPLSGSCFEHPAFLESVINSINETQCLSQTPEFGQLPTPYITEKTWKPLFAGNAILFTGQSGLKKQLESWGFVFDYVWARDYDDSPNDNQRLEVILHQINWILETDIRQLATMAQPSVDHNVELAWSGKLEKMFKLHNQRVMEELKEFLFK